MRRYFKQTGTQGMYAVMYYGHNLQFESAAAMFSGNFAEARAAATRTVELVDPIADEMAMVEPYAAQDLAVLVRFGRWDEVVAAKAPKPTRTIQTALYHFARGAALAGLGKSDEAAAELRALEQAAAKIPGDAVVGPANSAAVVAAVAIADLAARVAEARGDLPGAIAGFTRAVAAEDRLGYNEPPDWLLPERERLGVTLLKAGKAADAEAVFRADLVKHVDNPRLLFGLWRSLEAQKKYMATETRERFEKAWAAADVTLGPDLYATRP